jgi:hypothetical protein
MVVRIGFEALYEYLLHQAKTFPDTSRDSALNGDQDNVHVGRHQDRQRCKRVAEFWTFQNRRRH